jgi:Sec-independent protein translocase protein TatA
MWGLGGTELVVLLLLLVVLFGSARLPKAARNLVTARKVLAEEHEDREARE